MDLPFNTHPLYTLRKATILSATVGVIFSLGATSPYGSDAFQVEIFLVLVSLVFSAADVYCYAKFKKENPDQDPPWPTTKWMLGDGVLAVLLLLDFAAGLWMAQLDWSYRRNGMILPAYAALAAFFCSVFHAYCLYKQVVARYKARWLASIHIIPQPCARCGYSELPTAAVLPRAFHPVPQPATDSLPPNNFVYAGHSAALVPPGPASRMQTVRPAVSTPSSPDADSAMEEGLLIGSEFGTGYGSISTPEPDHAHDVTLEQPAEVVVGSSSKPKGKKKAVDKRKGESLETWIRQT
ncbi:hypothetical protein LTR01_001452 [Friedmanniomyces endolithicus]|nr:hypothetical protein LTR01_001452 [Friedmanniomyces endolithicus]KAK0830874.1 hypothetical protein LTR73_003261 [Friedmanniomyces endolithicus]